MGINPPEEGGFGSSSSERADLSQSIQTSRSANRCSSRFLPDVSLDVRSRSGRSRVTVDTFDEQVSSVAALGEPVRRQLYRYVVAQPEPVSRERAANGVGVPHHVATF